MYHPQPDEDTPDGLKEAYDYYLTPRCQHPRAANKMLIQSLPLVLNFDAFDVADVFLQQPTLVIVGEKAGSKWHSDRLVKSLVVLRRKWLFPAERIWTFTISWTLLILL